MSTENEKRSVRFLYSEYDSEEIVANLVRLMRPRLGILKNNPLGVSTSVVTPSTVEDTGAVVDEGTDAVVLLLSPGLEYALGGRKAVGALMDALADAGAPVIPVVLEPLAGDNGRGHWSYAGRRVFRGPDSLSSFCGSFVEVAEGGYAHLFATCLAQAIGHRLSGQGGYR